MTKTSKPAAITFPTVKGLKGVRRNAETGIEIHRDTDGCTIFRTERDGTLGYWGGGSLSLHEARIWATDRVEMIREQIAADHAEALDMDAAETARVAAEVIEGVAATTEDGGPLVNRVFRTLLFGAVHSAKAGFVQVGRDRLARARAILSGDEVVPTDEQADAEAAAFNERYPVGSMVTLTTGKRLGLRAKIVKTATVYAEHNRAAVLVKVEGKGHMIEWCDSLLPVA